MMAGLDCGAHIGTMRIAIVHDTIVVRGGAEIVLDQLLILYPKADIFTLVRSLTDDEIPLLRQRTVHTSFIQKLPFAKTRYRSYLALMPLAIEQFDLSGYDLVVSSSFCAAKGVITGPHQTHVSYVHSPVRYAWDMYHTYLREAGLERGLKGLIAKLVLHYIRIWDVRTANGVDVYIANSDFIAKRIWKVYRRKSHVVYPSVTLEDLHVQEHKLDYYFVTARMVPYKLIPLIVKSFSQTPGRRLVVAGDGPELSKAKAEAGPNIEFIGFVDRAKLVMTMAAAKAFVYAAREDFGIVMVEAQACGTPVIAFGEGGALETVVDGQTGILFFEQTSEAIVAAVDRFERDGVGKNAGEIRAHAEQFSAEKFRNKIQAIVEDALHKNKSHHLDISVRL